MMRDIVLLVRCLTRLLITLIPIVVRDIVLLARGLTRPLITLILVCAIVVLALRGMDAPETLKTITATAVGFWFAAHSLARDG